MSLMNRNDIAKAIAEDLLYNDALGEHNFSYDTAEFQDTSLQMYKSL